MITILVVEDNGTLRQLICTVLGKHGYRVLAAEDGQQALDILEAEYIDLIISDIMMPQMDGYELIERLRESKFNLPILIITAKDSIQDVDITDTGTGMTPEVQKHIFEKFYQGDRARTAEGNGLGLPLARRIVDLCRGRITVTSKPGQGATFTIELPRA